MPPPTPLKIKTSSVARLIKDELTYHKEIVAQKAVVERMEAENAEFYELKAQKKVLADTEQMIPELHLRLEQAVEALEMELEVIDEDSEEKQAAITAVEEAKKVYEGKATSVGNSLFTDVS
ncbi:hypothetical protein H072_8436 [Dactylellina haptotyla CBS 200.50]|uniref:Tubulin-specific chaperone A n=1 Tax=Dactylellina haptotyla (strain CBS 200.50) TaxID=1284197 RepID=S8A9R5_DACHA|nr:hypothetical protein H072_8436 [Dactylellina haptotyla CBS 200.50]